MADPPLSPVYDSRCYLPPQDVHAAMILERGDMWSIAGITDWFLITTNPIVTKKGLAVMGRGIAKEAVTKYPHLPEKFGALLQRVDYWKHPVFTIDKVTERAEPLSYDFRIGCFMVKHHWKHKARLDMISRSTEVLCDILCTATLLEARVDLNFPGIGNGGLPREDVLPIIEQLPDNVHIWEKG